MRTVALVLAGALVATDVDARGAAPSDSTRTDLFELDGEGGPAGRLQSALHDELRARALAGAEVASMTELRLAMSCKPGEIECLARGGRAMGLDRMIIGAVTKNAGGYEVELALIDVASGEMLQEVRTPIATAALGSAAIYDTAVSLVDALFPGTSTPSVFAAAPTLSPTADEGTSTAKTRAGRVARPRWMWAGFGASLGVATVFAAATVGMTIRLDVGLRNDLLAAVDASQDDENPENDVSRSEDNLCAAAREDPQNNGNVRNASVTRICNRADGVTRVRNGAAVLAAIGLASTLVFAILLAVNPKPRRRDLTLVPRFDGRGTSLVLGGRF